MAINVPRNYCTCFAPHHGCSTEFAVVRIKGTDLMLVSAAGMPAAPNFPDSVFSIWPAEIKLVFGSREGGAGTAGMAGFGLAAPSEISKIDRIGEFNGRGMGWPAMPIE